LLSEGAVSMGTSWFEVATESLPDENTFMNWEFEVGSLPPEEE